MHLYLTRPILSISTVQFTFQFKSTHSSQSVSCAGLSSWSEKEFHQVSVVRSSLWTASWTALDFTVWKKWYRKSHLKHFFICFCYSSGYPFIICALCKCVRAWISTRFQDDSKTCLLSLKIRKRRFIYSIFFNLFWEERIHLINLELSACLIFLSLSTFPNPHSSESRKGPKQLYVWSLPGKEGTLGLKCMSTDKVGNEQFHALRNLQFLLQDS